MRAIGGRPRLSTAVEEDSFLACDEILDGVVLRLAPLVKQRYRRIAGSANWRERSAAAVSLRQPGLARLAANWEMEARVAADMRTNRMFGVAKARGKKTPTVSEVELIDEAARAGVQMAIRNLPKKKQLMVDEELAVDRAHEILRQGAFVLAMHELDSARRGLERLSSSMAPPAMRDILDEDTLASSFGLNDTQARAISREAQSMIDRGVKRMDTRRYVRRRIEDAIDARSEMIANDIGNTAINAGSRAVLEQVNGEDESDAVIRVWVTREDEKVCRRCNRFAGSRAAPGEDFVSAPDEDGDVDTSPHTGIHPRCRCRERYEVGSLEEVA